MKKFICALVIFASNAALYGQSDFSFGTISLKGNGCALDTYHVITAPDQKTVSILFDKFLVEVPQYVMPNEKMDHKICHIDISANIPVGQKIDALEATVDFRGSVNMDIGTHANFKSLLVQWRGMRQSDSEPKVIANQDWNAGSSDEWIISKTMTFPIRGTCASSVDRQVQVTLRNLLTATIDANQDASQTAGLVTVDSSDIAGSLKFRVKTSACSNSSQTPACSGRVVTCRSPLVWSPTLCRCVVSPR